MAKIPQLKCIDPVRIQPVDLLRKHVGKVCVCGLVPLFDLSRPAVSRHLEFLRARPAEDVRATREEIASRVDAPSPN